MGGQNEPQRQQGSSLIETLMMLPILVVVTVAGGDLVRLAFAKAALDVVVENLALEIAVSMPRLRRQGWVRDSGSSESDLTPEVNAELEAKLDAEVRRMFTRFFYSDKKMYLRLYVQIDKAEAPPGVFVQVNACVPMVLRATVARDSGEMFRDCIGQFAESAPTFRAARLRSIAYVPHLQ